jgi:hypothetical protein
MGDFRVAFGHGHPLVTMNSLRQKKILTKHNYEDNFCNNSTIQRKKDHDFMVFLEKLAFFLKIFHNVPKFIIFSN